jgi:hypothetical protein
MGRISNWFPPFAGILFVALFVLVFALIGEGVDATEETAQEIVDHYQDNEEKEFIARSGSALLRPSSSTSGLAAQALRDAEG